MSRIRRIAMSFAIVLVAHWAYALVAVPLIEPAAQEGIATTMDGDVNADSLQQYLRQLDGLFPPGSWQLSNPRVLANGHTMLLSREYRNMGDGRVEIRPCTVVQFPSDVGNDATQRRRQAVVIDAPEGAVLKFDKPINFGSGEMGRLEAGQVSGTITIRSQGKLAGPEDDLYVATENLVLSDRLVQTGAAVEFRYGANYGRGREMTIGLAEPDDSAPARGTQMGIGDLESIEIKHIERLHLEPSARPKTNDKPSKGPSPGGLPALGGQADLPVEVTCRGPFRFDLDAQTASFRDQVDVLRIHPNGPSDQLSCEKLKILLAERREQSEKPGRQKGKGKDPKKRRLTLMDLEPKSLEADGEPATISAPSQQMQAQGRRLRYDMWTGAISLEGAEEVWMRQQANEIHGVSLQYTPSAGQRMGQVEAKGPGWFRGHQATQRGPQPVDARWNGWLRVRPQQQNQLISLIGGAELQFQEMGKLAAEEIHFWVHELPGAAAERPGQVAQDASRFVPDRMMADKNVRLASPQLTCAVEHMEVQFEQAGGPPTALPSTPSATPPAAKPSGPEIRRFQAPERIPAPTAPPGTSSIGRPRLLERADLLPTQMRVPATSETVGWASPTVLSESSVVGGAHPTGLDKPAAPPQHFTVEGRVLRARMILRGQQADVAELTVDENVRFIETQVADPNEKPLVITGDRIHAISPNEPDGTISVLGRLARFEGRGLTLSGANLNLNRSQNRLWVEGPGTMTLPMERMPDTGLLGRPASNPPPVAGPPVARAATAPPGPPSTLDIRWHEGMTFDGQTAVFRNQVTAIAPQRHIDTETMEVRLRQKINFAEANSRHSPEVENLVCRGGLWMESITLENEEPTAVQRAQLADLSVNMTSGAAAANGPGWLVHISRRGSNPLEAGGGTMPLLPTRTQAPRPDDGSLSGLYVRFQGPMSGNIHNREATFRDRVQTAYGPVQTWQATLDPDRPELLGPQGMTMVTQEMTVRQMPNPLDGRYGLELTAIGNVVAESVAYTARAHRLAYSQIKDLLILEGDGRTDALFYRQPAPGSPQTGEMRNQRIEYHPSTGRAMIVGPHSIDVQGGMPAMPPRPATKPGPAGAKPPATPSRPKARPQ